MAPTLVGVTLVTFALLVLAPPPDESERDPEARERYRRSLFLDLPLFVNSDPIDLERAVDVVLERAASGEPPGPLASELARRGTALVPVLVPRLASLPPRARDVALASLAPIERSFGGDESAVPDDRVAFWTRTFEARRLDFRASHVRRLVRRLVDGGGEHVENELEILGTFALEPLFDALAASDTERARVAIEQELARIVPFAMPPGARARAGTRASRDAWREWWFANRSDYVRFDRAERVARTALETRYGRWVTRLATLELGVSLHDGRPIAAKLRERAPVTVGLAALAATLAIAIAIPLGVFAATRHGKPIDRGIGVGSLIVYALPLVWVGTLLVRFFAGPHGFAIFPGSGLASPGMDDAPLGARIADIAWHLALPVTCLAYRSLVSLSRFQRSAMLDVTRSDYVRTARAKGLPEHIVILRHALRNALLPLVTLAGVEVPLLLGTAVVVEEIFQLPGLGMETLLAVRERDVTWLVAVTALGAVLTIAGVMLTDLLYLLIDPRTRRGRVGAETEAP